MSCILFYQFQAKSVHQIKKIYIMNNITQTDTDEQCPVKLKLSLNNVTNYNKLLKE